MAGKRKNPLWRKVFLRALASTGNARASAVEAGVDVGTAYDHRIKDPGFAGQWAGALTKYSAVAAKKPRPLHPRASRGGPPPRSGEELVLRRTRHGDKLVRAAPGRWCARVEETFFDGLEVTGCVRTAAAAAGISTNALYARRKAYPEFAGRWDEIEARAAQQLPTLLHTAAVVSLGPEAGASGDGKRRGRGRLPKVNVDQAIRISRIKGAGAGAGEGRRGGIRFGPRAATKEEVIAQLKKGFAALERRRRKERLAQGWTELEDDVWIPPGWVHDERAGGGAAPAADAGEDGEAGDENGEDGNEHGNGDARRPHP
jgi:hypothetical protein